MIIIRIIRNIVWIINIILVRIAAPVRVLFF